VSFTLSTYLSHTLGDPFGGSHSCGVGDVGVEGVGLLGGEGGDAVAVKQGSWEAKYLILI
jgi:hypothetical protein